MEVQTLFEKCGLPNESKLVYQTSVELKKLVGFIKRRVNRKEVTKEAGFGEMCFQTIFFIFPTMTIDYKSKRINVRGIR